ncbi:MAG: hypothetical protein RIR76_413 [Verrucomicrobiota bacterium]|mgnify:FL=1|jgi:type II secretion system protein J
MIARRTFAPRARRRGFTLLELIIATAVGAVVLVVIQTTFFSALRLHNTTHARLAEDQSVQRAAGIIRRDLAGLVLPGGASGMARELSSAGETLTPADSLGERVTPDIYTSSGRIDGWTPFGDLQAVAYFLAPSGQGGRGRNLVRAVTRNLLPVQEAVPEDQVILGDVDSAALSYFDGTAWTDSWESADTQTLPVAFRFSIVRVPPAGGQAASAPVDIVVPVLVRTTTSQTLEAEEAAP